MKAFEAFERQFPLLLNNFQQKHNVLLLHVCFPLILWDLSLPSFLTHQWKGNTDNRTVPIWNVSSSSSFPTSSSQVDIHPRNTILSDDRIPLLQLILAAILYGQMCKIKQFFDLKDPFKEHRFKRRRRKKENCILRINSSQLLSRAVAVKCKWRSFN